MMSKHFSPRVLLAILLLAGATVPTPARAIPVFANGQGVSCQQCHSTPPNLNPYGRYILATNFSQVLNAHAQMVENGRDPVSLIVAGDGSNTPDPTLPKVFAGLIQLNSAGYLGNDVTYYASVPIVSGGFPAQALDQLWAAYNGFSSGNGSLQAGKFPTPFFAPWLSQSLSLSGYSLAAMPVGLNTVGVGDNRWGTSYTQIGGNGLIANVAYMANTGPIERAYDNNINSTTAAAEGQSYVVSLQQMNIASHITGGIAALQGTFPLPSGAQDSYTRTMALASYSTSPKYSVIAMALIGHDNNPNDGATTASGSNGWSFEGIYGPTKWLHLDARYERTNDGLGTIQNNYVGDIAFSIMPNLFVTLENVSTIGARPVMSYQVLWAGPMLPRRVVPPAAKATTTTTNPQAVALGQQIFATNCAECHGVNGDGATGPDIHGIATRKSLDQAVAFIEAPTGAMPKLYPSVLSAVQVQAVATYISKTFK